MEALSAADESGCSELAVMVMTPTVTMAKFTLNRDL